MSVRQNVPEVLRRNLTNSNHTMKIIICNFSKKISSFLSGNFAVSLKCDVWCINKQCKAAAKYIGGNIAGNGRQVHQHDHKHTEDRYALRNISNGIVIFNQWEVIRYFQHINYLRRRILIGQTFMRY
jgi:hypothetical protein